MTIIYIIYYVMSGLKYISDNKVPIFHGWVSRSKPTYLFNRLFFSCIVCPALSTYMQWDHSHLHCTSYGNIYLRVVTNISTTYTQYVYPFGYGTKLPQVLVTFELVNKISCTHLHQARDCKVGPLCRQSRHTWKHLPISKMVNNITLHSCH